MVDRIVKTVKKGRADAWDAFKKTLSITGYKYYVPPVEVKYRYPAPGSCALDVEDHPNLYKNNWKTPFRQSDYNIQKIEYKYDIDDPREALNLISANPHFDASHPMKGKYDQVILNEADPNIKRPINYENLDNGSEQLRKELWNHFEGAQNEMKLLRRDFAPGIHDYDDDYNQYHITWQNRGATGFENNPRMKEMFVELEYWIEEVIGKSRRIEGKVKAYKGTPKKWQILDDAVYDREQIDKLQAATDAPLPEQLEQWKEKHDKPIMAPFNNENVSKWRDDPRYYDSADFDPKLLDYDRDQKRRLFLERYEKPKELEQKH